MSSVRRWHVGKLVILWGVCAVLVLGVDERFGSTGDFHRRVLMGVVRLRALLFGGYLDLVRRS